MAALAKDLGLERVALIANKMREDRDLDAVLEFAQRNELEIGGIIPHDVAGKNRLVAPRLRRNQIEYRSTEVHCAPKRHVIRMIRVAATVAIHEAIVGWPRQAAEAGRVERSPSADSR